MSAPSSQTKISYKHGKTEVSYVSNLDASQYYLYELCRAALKDVGKFITKKFRELYYQHFKKITGNGGRAVIYHVISGKSTTAPRVQVGLPKSYRGNEVPGFYAYFQEFGTSTGVPRLGLITKAVQDNVAEIVKIESQYLSGLDGEAARLQELIDERPFEGDADED